MFRYLSLPRRSVSTFIYTTPTLFLEIGIPSWWTLIKKKKSGRRKLLLSIVNNWRSIERKKSGGRNLAQGGGEWLVFDVSQPRNRWRSPPIGLHPDIGRCVIGYLSHVHDNGPPSWSEISSGRETVLSLRYHAFSSLSLGTIVWVARETDIFWTRVKHIDRSVWKEVRSKSRNFKIFLYCIEKYWDWNFESSKWSEASKLSFDVGVF